MQDDLGDRMKSQYETRTQVLLPRRTYTLIRIDGKAFHSYTKHCEKPFDAALMEDMDRTMQALCSKIQGCCLGYVQSDEISLLLEDFHSTTTAAWFDGNLQKIVSVSASIATAEFNNFRALRYNDDAADNYGPFKVACFDSRAWTIPDREEVCNYFVWRQKDASRNSVSMVGHAYFGSATLHGKSCDEIQEMLWQDRQINWSTYPEGCKNGRVAYKITEVSSVEYTNKRTGEKHTTDAVERSRWQVEPAMIFTQNRDWLLSKILAMGVSQDGRS